MYTRVPDSEILSRIAALKNELEKNNLDGALLFSIQELLYYSGIGLDGVIYVPVDGNPIHLVKRNLNLAKMYSYHNVYPFNRPSKLFETLEIPAKKNLVIEKDILPAIFVEFLESKTNSKLMDGSLIFREIRSIKSKYEIQLIQEAAKLVDKVFDYCVKIARPEMSEIQLASLLESWLLNNGHSGHITTRAFNASLLHYAYVISSQSSSLNIHFTPISGCGLSTKYPYGPSRNKLGKNKPFFLDACGNYQGYISDTTRTFIFGKYDIQTKEELESLITIKEYIKQHLKPKQNLGILFEQVMELSRELKIFENFMGSKVDKSPFLGHGVGLELDELPIFYKKGSTLATGNVLACEPKFFIEKEKVLGIEDTFAITDSSNIPLSKAINYFEI